MVPFSKKLFFAFFCCKKILETAMFRFLVLFQLGVVFHCTTCVLVCNWWLNAVICRDWYWFCVDLLFHIQLTIWCTAYLFNLQLLIWHTTCASIFSPIVISYSFSGFPQSAEAVFLTATSSLFIVPKFCNRLPHFQLQQKLFYWQYMFYKLLLLHLLLYTCIFLVIFSEFLSYF